MAVPPNASFATAVDFGVAKRGSATLDVYDSGTTYDVYYKFTAVANVSAYWAFAFGGTPDSGYQPHVEVYDAAEVLVLASSDNKPLQFVVTGGATYYLKVEKNANVNPSVFTLEFLAHTQQPLAVASIIVPDDSEDFPATVLSTKTGNKVMKFVPSFPPGEAGDILTVDGVSTFLVEDFVNNEIKLYDARFNLLVAIPVANDNFRIRANRTAQRFYVGNRTGTPVVFTVSPAGVVGSSHTLTAYGGLGGLATSGDETIIYHARNTSASAIERWDAVNDVALSSLAAGEAGYFVIDILVLDDDSVLATYVSFATDGRVRVKRFDPDGTVLHVYDFGRSLIDHEFPSSTAPRLAYDQEPGIFWIWTHHSNDNGEGVSRFRRIYA